MNNLNSLLIEGNLTKDPVLGTTNGGTEFCKFSIATNRFYKDASDNMVKETSFFDVECWAKLAQIVYDNASKGRGVRVVGRIKQERWKDATSGQNRSRVVIVAQNVDFRAERPRQEETRPAVEETVEGNF
jgi:single-strand DNA-binding protein